MRFNKFRIFVSKGWTFIICSLSVAMLALMGSCRSKKVAKAQEVVEDQDKSSEMVTQENVLSDDSKDLRDMIEESNALKETLGRRMNTVIYGPPEMMQKRAAENQEMQHKIDSLDARIKAASGK